MQLHFRLISYWRYRLPSLALTYTLFFKSNTFISNARLNWQKIKQMLSNTLRLNFCYLKIIYILHPRNHRKITGHVLKNKRKNKCVCIHEIIRLIRTRMKMRIKPTPHSYNINRARPSHGHKYSKCKKCLSMMMLIKQHLSNIWSWIYEKLRNTEAGLKKKRCL